MQLLINGLFISLLLVSCNLQEENNEVNRDDMKEITLPEPEITGEVPLEETLEQRRSVRDYTNTPVSLEEIGQLAWAAQGITEEMSGYRTAPSAGATYPIELYFLLTGVENVSDGVYHYQIGEHTLVKTIDGDQRFSLFDVALQQDAITNAPVVMVITGVLARTEQRYGGRARRYMYMEAGHVSQNIYLQSVPLNLGTVCIGAFDDDGVANVINLDEGEYPLYIMPVGKVK